CNEQNAAQCIGYAADLGLISAVADRILGAEFCDLALGAAFSGEQITPIRQRQKILRAAFDHAQSAFVQLQVLNDLRLQQAHSISRSRATETWMEFLSDAGATDHTTSLKNAHAQSGHPEIGRTRQAIVASTDYDGIDSGHRFAMVGSA